MPTSLSLPSPLKKPIPPLRLHSHCIFPLFNPKSLRLSLSAADAEKMFSVSALKAEEKVIVIMGATGCGKSRLSIDLASDFESEIINSDKMQVYKGLDITTNKISVRERRGTPHHLLGVVDPYDGEFTSSEFRERGGLVVSDIVQRQKLPIVVGGSNSFIHALLVERFNQDSNVFNPSRFGSVCATSLRYQCCFIWVDVSFTVLCDYLCKRVDEMLDSGMFDELMEYFKSVDPRDQPGLGKAIGVPELYRFFKKYHDHRTGLRKESWDQVRRRAYEAAVREIKENTCQLAERQMNKIMRLRDGQGWDLKRVDATEAFMEVMTSALEGDDVEVLEEEEGGGGGTAVTMVKKKKKRRKKWEEVVEQSVKLVKSFLEE